MTATATPVSLSTGPSKAARTPGPGAAAASSSHATAARLSPDDWVMAAPFRAHVAQLVANSAATPETLARAARVPVGVVRRLCSPRAPRRIRRCDAERLLQLTVSQFLPLPPTPGSSVAAMSPGVHVVVPRAA